MQANNTAPTIIAILSRGSRGIFLSRQLPGSAASKVNALPPRQTSNNIRMP
ncbi:MAG TPA: hypothetical protein VIZ18_01410 [Ktedonobacteraceae bacterium]